MNRPKGPRILKFQEELCCIAKAIVANGKGILAADETASTLGKRFQDKKIANSEESRRIYRQLLITAAPQVSSYISGIILSEETAHQVSDNGATFPQLLRSYGIIPGIKVDTGVVELIATGEPITQGLDKLAERLHEYKKMGFDFAKWRCVFKIGHGIPTHLAIAENASVLARYASICQSECIVPIIEPEVLAEGAHDIHRCKEVTQEVLAAVFKALSDHHVVLEGILLKPNMVTPGQGYPSRATPEEIGEATVVTLRRTVPPAVPGIAFLSGGQSEEDATMNLNAINRVNRIKPWTLTFSFGRALQYSVIQVWGGCPSNAPIAQEQLAIRAKDNWDAANGQYSSMCRANTADT